MVLGLKKKEFVYGNWPYMYLYFLVKPIFFSQYFLRLIVPLVSFGTPWPNKQNHKTLHFQNFLNEKFNAASIKITIFKIKSHFTEYSSVLLSLSIILTEICIFSKIFKQMQILQKTKRNLHIFSTPFTFS